jgi:hypothetical protein
MKRCGSMKRLIEKFDGNRITKSGSYNTNKSIIQIDIPTQVTIKEHLVLHSTEAQE